MVAPESESGWPVSLAVAAKLAAMVEGPLVTLVGNGELNASIFHGELVPA